MSKTKVIAHRVVMNVTGHHGCHKINVTGHRECHKLMSFDIMNDTKLMSQMSLNVNSTGMSKTKVIAHRVVMNVTTMSLDIMDVTKLMSLDIVNVTNLCHLTS